MTDMTDMQYPVPNELKDWCEIDQTKAVTSFIPKRLKETDFKWYKRRGYWLPARKPTIQEKLNNEFS